MKKLFTLCLSLALATNLIAQRFRSYHAYGAQFNVNISALQTTHSGNYGHVYVGQNMNSSSVRSDIYFHYDYGMLKWLGVGTGLGISFRGGEMDDPVNPQYNGKRNLTYLNIPLRVQFKPWHFLWIEPGVELLYKMGYKDEGEFPSSGIVLGAPFDPDQINSIGVNGMLALRFNIFRGLSLNAGYSIGLTDVAEVEAPSPPYPYIATSYKNWAMFIGLRYMFNQAEKS